MKDREKLLIFDCDGVLVDSEIVASLVEIRELDRCGCYVTLDRYLEAALGRAEEEVVWEELAAEAGVQLPSDFASTTRQKVTRSFEQELKPVKGVGLALRQIQCPMCVASGSRPERLLRNLELTGLAGYFGKNVFSSSQVKRGKPFPDLFHYAASSMGITEENCLVIEDSLVGVTAARAAGMRVVGFLGASHWTHVEPPSFRDAGCDLMFDDMRDLPEICRSFVAGEMAQSS